LGDLLPEGEITARAIYDALDKMAWFSEAVVVEASGKRKTDGLAIAFRSDGMSVCEENTEQTCAALTDASELCVRPHDEDTFWFEIYVPHVFPESDSPVEQSVSVEGDRLPAYEDATLPEWLTDAFKAIKEERDELRFEDFAPNYEHMTRFADVYAAVKMLAASTGAVFEFTKPEPPHNLHGGVHLKVHGSINLEKEMLDALIAVLKTSRSLSVSNTNDGHVYLSFWVNDIYRAKE